MIVCESVMDERLPMTYHFICFYYYTGSQIHIPPLILSISLNCRFNKLEKIHYYGPICLKIILGFKEVE